jgi:hypothetical protein
MARFRVIVARNRSKCSGTLLENEDVWADLLDLLLPEGDGCVAVLTAYIDASERKDSGLFSVAGYLFESGRVRRFRQERKKTFGSLKFSWADLIVGSHSSTCADMSTTPSMNNL